MLKVSLAMGISIMIICVLATSGQALTECVNSTDLHTLLINNNTVYWNATEPCEGGCLDGKCQVMDSTRLFYVGVVLVLMAFFFFYLSKDFNMGGEKYSWPLQYLFLFSALLIMLVVAGILSGNNIFGLTSTSSILDIVYMLIIFVFWVVVGAFMVYLIILGYEWMTGKKDKKKGEKDGPQ